MKRIANSRQNWLTARIGQRAGNIQEGGHNVENNTHQTQDRAEGLLQGLHHIFLEAQERPRQRGRQRSLSPPSISGHPPVQDLDLQDTFAKRVQAFFQTKVMKIDDDSITINLATFQRVRILRLQQELVIAAYKYRFRKGGTPQINPPPIIRPSSSPLSSNASSSDGDGSSEGSSISTISSLLFSLDDGESDELDPQQEQVDIQVDDGITPEDNTPETGGTTGVKEHVGLDIPTTATKEVRVVVQEDQPPLEGEALVPDGHTVATEAEPEHNHPANQNETTMRQGENAPAGTDNGPERQPEPWEQIFEPEDEYPRLVRKYSRIDQ